MIITCKINLNNYLMNNTATKNTTFEKKNSSGLKIFVPLQSNYYEKSRNEKNATWKTLSNVMSQIPLMLMQEI